MPSQPAEQSALTKKALVYAQKWLAWKTGPRPDNAPPPNPVNDGLSPQQGQEVIENCIRAMEEAVVERATKPIQPRG